MMSDAEPLRGRGTVAPFKLPPPYLGGLPIGGANQVNPESVYGQLPRPRIISTPWRASPKTTNEAYRKVYSSMYCGNFYGLWIMPLHEVDDFESARFTLGVGADDEEALMRISIWSKPAENGHVDRVGRASSVLFNCGINEEFKAAFTIRDKTRLCHRMLHLYSRKYGNQIPFVALQDIFCILSEEYIRKKWYEGFLDICIIYVDVAFNGGKSSNVHLRMGRVQQVIGEALESLGEFEEAARLYKEMAVMMHKHVHWEQRAVLYVCAGLAFKRAQDYVSAEQAYVTALNFYSTYASSAWDVNSDESTIMLTNILMLYYQWGRLNTNPNRFATDIEKMEPALIGILFCAGFKAGLGGISECMINLSGPVEKEHMKRNVRTRAGAMGALTSATATTSVSDFRKEVLSCCQIQDIVIDLPVASANEDIDLQGARNVLGEGSDASSLVSCGNDACDKRGPRYKDLEGYFRHCPCKTVYYCSKECQNIDWQSHKAVCQWHLEKKKAKEEKKKSRKGKK